MNKQYCALCGKELLSDQKCTITVKGKRSGFYIYGKENKKTTEKNSVT